MTEQEDNRKNHFPDLEEIVEARSLLTCIGDIIDRIPLFEDFEQGDVVGIARYMRCHRAAPGRPLIREGDRGDFMLLLLDGNIEIVKAGTDGLPRRISVVMPGETLGEMSLVDGEARFASCVTIDTVTFAVLDRAGLESIFADEPHLGIKILRELLKLLNQRLRETGQRLVEALAPLPAGN